MSHYPNKNYKRNQGPTVLEVVIVAVFKALWFLVKLPFKKGMKGKRQGIDSAARGELISKRHEIESLLSSENIIELKHAVSEADKLVDQALKLQGYAGETFADRLRSAESNIDQSLYRQVWDGHIVRNKLAHQSDFIITNQELREAAEKLLRYIKQV